MRGKWGLGRPRGQWSGEIKGGREQKRMFKNRVYFKVS